MRKWIGGLSVLLFMTGHVLTAMGEPLLIEDGKKVKIDYTLTVNGEVVDTSEGKEPLEYTQGEGAIIPGLEKELAGLKAGDEKTVVVAPGEAYGEVRVDAFQEVPKNIFPPEIDLKVGMILPLANEEGQQMPVLVSEIKGDSVVLDLNHPLAGKELTFAVTVVDVQ